MLKSSTTKSSMLKRFFRPLASAFSLVCLSQVILAGPINVVAYGDEYNGYNGAADTGMLGGYNMTHFTEMGVHLSSVTSVASPVDNQLVLGSWA